MEIVTSFAESLFLNTIAGVLILSVAVYLIALGISKIVPKSPNPSALAGIAFFAGIFTLPSIPRYQFETDSLSLIEGKEWMRVVNKTHWGSVIEPLTWFKAPIGSFFIVMPNSPIDGGFREILLRYEEEARITMTEPNCSNKTILYSVPNSEGQFVYISRTPQAMNEQEIAVYCEYDWTKEKEALRAEILNQIRSK